MNVPHNDIFSFPETAQFVRVKARYNWSFSNLMYFLRMNLLVYRDLWDWLNDPFVPRDVGDRPTQFGFSWN